MNVSSKNRIEISLHPPTSIGVERKSGEMALMNCPECSKQISDQAKSCPNCGWVVPKKQIPEEVLLKANPAMFRSNPIGFICSVILIAAFGLGLVILFVWWLKCKTRTITITNKRTTVREGLISKNTSEILHSHIQNIQVIQGVLDRIFGVGTLAISSAAQSDMELSFPGLAHPEKIRSLIDEHRA